MDELSQRILENSKRLLEDAVLLQSHGRHPSSIGLAIFSIEELGKFLLLQWETDTDVRILRKGITYHRAKQAVLGALYNADVTLNALTDFLTRHGGKNFIVIPEKEALEHGLIPLSEEQRSEKLEFHEGTAEFVASHLAEFEHRNLIYRSVSGVLEKLKHLSFYVDQEKIQDLDEWKFTKDDADQMIEHAKKAQEFLDNEVRLRMAKEIYIHSLKNSVADSESGNLNN